MAQIGVTTRERDAGTRSGVTGPAIGQMGAVFEAPAGPVGVAVLSQRENDSKLIWGGANRNYNSWYQLRGFHRNCGEYGGDVYGVRVVSSGTTAAAPATVTGTEEAPFTLANGDTLVLNTDGGGNETTTFSAGAAVQTASGKTYPVTYSGSKTLVFNVGTHEYTVTFPNGSLSLQDVLQEINNVEKAYGFGFTAKDNGGQVEIVTTQKGTGASLEILGSSTGLSELGLSAGASAGTGDAANIARMTIAELKTAVEAATTGLTVSDSGGFPKFTGTTTGTSGSIEVVSGALSAFGLTAGTTNGTNTASEAPTAATHTAQRSATDVWKFTAGYLGLESPGTHANSKVYVQIVEITGDATKRHVFVGLKEAPATSPAIVERHYNLDANNVASVINSASKYVKVAIVGGDTGLPDVAVMEALTGGTDEGGSPSNADYEAALNHLDGKPCEVVTNFDLADSTWQASLETYCAGRGDVQGVFSTPESASITTINSSFASARGLKKYTVGIRNHMTVRDDFGGTIKVSGVARAIGSGWNRRRKERGINAHLNPAGPRTEILDVEEIDDAEISAEDLQSLVDGSNINSFVKHPVQGYYYLKTADSMSTEPKWHQANTRLFANYLAKSFTTSLIDFEQESNTSELRDDLRTKVDDFMIEQYEKGALNTNGGYDNNVTIVCDESNNPNEVALDNRTVCEMSYVQAGVNRAIEMVLTKSQTGLAVTAV